MSGAKTVNGSLTMTFETPEDFVAGKTALEAMATQQSGITVSSDEETLQVTININIQNGQP